VLKSLHITVDQQPITVTRRRGWEYEAVFHAESEWTTVALIVDHVDAGIGGDIRTLGLALDWLEIVPQP
jgi:hypothetical protein